jgi:hypothetical protein
MKADNKQFHERWLADIKVNRLAVTAMVRSLFPSVATALGSMQGRRSDGEYVTVPEWTPSQDSVGLRWSRAMAKRDAESWAAIVAEAETAGVPHGETAKKHGVTLATLKYHLYRSRDAGKKKVRTPRVLPVRVVTNGTASVDAQFGSVRVSFHDGCDPAYVVAVLSALGKC